MTPDTSGPGSQTPFAYYDPDTRSLRMSQLTLDLDLTPSSVTLPRSGSMRSGRLYERPTLGRATNGTGSSSSLPTPKAQEAGWNVANTTTVNGASAEPGQRAYDAEGVHKIWGMQQVVDSLLPTPRERDHKNAAATEQTALDRIDRGYGLDIAEAIQLLPTPRAMSGGPDNSAGKTRPSGHKGTTNLHGLIQGEFGVDLIGTPTTEPPADVPGGIVKMLPTPTTQDGANCGGRSQLDRNSPPLNAVVTMTDWGKYAPAIERWAEVIDRPAPEPTDDKGRLNPTFVEWMMGYPEGWIEGVSRTGQLKALGNAIVPHQAAAAWGHLLGLNVFAEAGGGHLLPTPRASDGNGPGHHGTGGPDLRTVICR